ncbi:MAG TPA: AlpA family phage regulatory protein [Alicycliphilus sp.]|nr:AlpA family phage regulatory protein [Alicycliphilus sp.]HRP20060.1 AlpA family phage regulatory protein [Alicycliphilus sp.]
MTTTEGALLRLPAVLAKFPVSRSGWYEGVRIGRYPPPVKLGARAVAWRRSDIERLITELTEGGHTP